ncbi:MAG TPA: NAD(P)/FAD-dependent oxidoreductase [Gemmatimonadales bacterium]
MSRSRVVIVGAGFGGLACARALAGKPVDVLLLDRHNYHLFTPLLYQVASSLLNPSDIAYPIRAVFRRAANVRVRVAEVLGADFEERVVVTRKGKGEPGDGGNAAAAGHRIPYDYLVLASGSTNNFFGIRPVEEHALPLKDLPDAMALRNHVLTCFEAASRVSDEVARQSWLTFVLVGAGPTGVELAGAFSELIRLVLVKDFPELDMGKVRIVLVEGRDEVLPAFPRPLGADARLRLQRRNIEVRLSARVTDLSGDTITLSDGERITAKTLVWAAGVKPGDLAQTLALPATRSGRVQVDACLRVTGQERVFAIGDIAAVPYQGGEMPMLSAPAIQEGRYVARSILSLERAKPVEPFRYRDKGIMATIGRHAAVAQLGRLRFTGFVGWAMWLLVHLYFIIGFRNRIVVLVEWAWDYFRYDRPIRLIERARGLSSIV